MRGRKNSRNAGTLPANTGVEKLLPKPQYNKKFRRSLSIILAIVMWKDFWTAIALVLIIEGILPFLSPQNWQRAIRIMIERNPRFVRMMGFLCMMAGMLLLFWIRR